MWDPYAEFQSSTLANGLTVHAAHWPERPWEAMGFLIHSGAKHDPPGLEGLAHFIEHLVCKNTKVSKSRIEGFFKDSGGKVDLGRTSYPYTQYCFFVPTDRTVLARAFSIFGHMLLSAKLEKFIEEEKRVIVGEFRRRYPFEFRYDLDVRKNHALYAGYWLERFVRPLGNLDSIEQITASDLQLYYDHHYTPANISVVGVGGLALSELVDFLSESAFSREKPGGRTPLPSFVTDIVLPLETHHVFKVSDHVTAPIEVGAYRSVTKIPGGINPQALRILKGMLNEVLNEEVREKRSWAYSTSCTRYNFQRFHEVSINCEALALKALDEIEEVIEACLISMAGRVDLFEQLKGRALASNFMIDLTGRGVCNGALGDLSVKQRIISLAECGDDIERVTMDDIRDLLQWLRPEQRWTLITRP